MTLSGLFAAPENSLSTVLITIPDNSVRTVTVSGVEFVVVDQSILQEVVSVVFCDEGDSGCMAALAINPIDANLVTVFISGDGAETTNAEFVLAMLTNFVSREILARPASRQSGVLAVIFWGRIFLNLWIAGFFCSATFWRVMGMERGSLWRTFSMRS